MSSAREVMATSLVAAALFAGSACTPRAQSNPSALPPGLAGTDWQLVEFQSADDAIGTLRPDDPGRYTMSLAPDGGLSMRLDCNRASGRWTATEVGSGSGSFAVSGLAMTRAFCAPPSLGDQIARQAEYLRSYLLRDRRLYLSLMADGGIYAWEPMP
jgi:heat shock protein HslJ